MDNNLSKCLTDNKIKLNFSANDVFEDEWSSLVRVLVCKIIKMGKPLQSSMQRE